jgi:hypothetical protein
MKLIALIALDLAFLRVQPSRLLQSPPFLFALVALDVVTIQFFILGRRLGPFHHAFLIIGLVASLALSTFFHDGVFHRITGTPTNRPSPGSLIADRYITSTLGLLLAWSAGLRAAHRPPGSLSWSIASFLQGAVIGFGVFTGVFTAILVTFLYYGQAAARLTPGQFAWLLGFGSALCPLLGGAVVLLLRSRRNPERNLNRP